DEGKGLGTYRERLLGSRLYRWRKFDRLLRVESSCPVADSILRQGPRPGDYRERGRSWSNRNALGRHYETTRRIQRIMEERKRPAQGALAGRCSRGHREPNREHGLGYWPDRRCRWWLENAVRLRSKETVETQHAASRPGPDRVHRGDARARRLCQNLRLLSDERSAPWARKFYISEALQAGLACCDRVAEVSFWSGVGPS